MQETDFPPKMASGAGWVGRRVLLCTVFGVKGETEQLLTMHFFLLFPVLKSKKFEASGALVWKVSNIALMPSHCWLCVVSR